MKNTFRDSTCTVVHRDSLYLQDQKNAIRNVLIVVPLHALEAYF